MLDLQHVGTLSNTDADGSSWTSYLVAGSGDTDNGLFIIRAWYGATVQRATRVRHLIYETTSYCDVYE